MTRSLLHISVLTAFLFLTACTPKIRPLPGPDLADHLLAMRSPAPQWKGADLAYVPPDDAPIEDLLDFWTAEFIDHGSQSPTPTEIVRRRLLSACVDQPRYIVPLLYCLPETPEACNVIHSAAVGLPDDESEPIRDWLMTRSKYGRENLLAIATGAAPPAPTQIDQPTALAALARLDWAKAEPLLRKSGMGRDKVMAATALEIEYHHAAIDGDKALMGVFRERLENITDDRTNGPQARRRACAALLAMNWDGRDEWINSLLDDPKLAGTLNIKNSTLAVDSQDSDVFAEPLKREPDRYIPMLAKFAADANPDVRQAGLIRLVQYPRADALRPALGLLNDETGKPDDPRDKLLAALASIEVPESIPSLSKLARQDEGTKLTEVALALVHQHAPNANDVVNKTLAAIEAAPDHMPFDIPLLDARALVKAAVDHQLLSDEQIVKSIEAYAATRIPDDKDRASAGLFGAEEKAWPHDACIGAFLIEIPSLRPGIAEKLLERWATLRKGNPAVAAAIWDIVIEWPDSSVDDRLTRLISVEPLDERVVAAAIARAAKLRERHDTCLRDLIRRGGDRAGLAAALLTDPAVSQSLLDGSDIQAKRMLFAAGRLARTPLPVPTVGRLMAASDARLSYAAERYLSCEDSPEARRLVLARHPGEVLILGAGWGGFPEDPDPIDNADNLETPLREEMHGRNRPDDIYAMFHSGMGYYEGCEIIRRRGTTATLEVQPFGTIGKLITRDLSADELHQLLEFVARTHFDDLPQLETNMVDGPMTGYLHLARAGGRSVFMHGEGRDGTAGSPHYCLERLFVRLSETGTYQTHYPKLQQACPGLQVLFGDSKLSLNAVWKHGDDLLVSQGEKAAQKWHVFSDGKLGDSVASPAGFVPTEYDQYDHPETFFLNTPQIRRRWQAVAGDSVIIWKDDTDSDGLLYRWCKPQPPVPLGKVTLANPVTTYDGKWVLATREGSLVGMNLADEKTHSYTLPAGRIYEAQAYVPVLDKMLVAGSKKADDATDTQYWLVDPAMDKVEPVKGDFEPLLHTVGRMIPSATNANDVWLTIWDDSLKLTRLIRYDLKVWKGTEVLTLPDIRVTNDRLAVDEQGGAAYIVIFGDLLRVPIPISAATAPVAPSR